MKIRNFFVSNSSSSSFTIKKENLSRTQLELVRAYAQEWELQETDEMISGHSSGDDGSIHKYFVETLEIDRKDISWRVE